MAHDSHPDNDEDHHPSARDPRARFTEAAVRHGLIRPGDKLDQNLATDIIGMCADIGDHYGDDEAGGNAGEHIRAELYGSTNDVPGYYLPGGRNLAANAPAAFIPSASCSIVTSSSELPSVTVPAAIDTIPSGMP